MMTRLIPGQSKTFVKGAGTKVHGDGADHADRVEAGQRGEILGHRQNENGNADRSDERDERDAMRIQASQAARHFPVLGHHVNDPDQSDHRGINGAKKEEAEDNPDDHAEGLTHSGPEGHSPVLLGEEAQHVLFGETSVRG